MSVEKQKRNTRIHKLASKNTLSYGEIGKAFGISKEMVYKIKKRHDMRSEQLSTVRKNNRLTA